MSLLAFSRLALSFTFGLGLTALSAAGQTTDCPDLGTRFVSARAEVNAWTGCTGATVRVNGITVTTGQSHPNLCPTLVTYYPAHYEGGVAKRGFRLGSKRQLPITVFQRECVTSYLLFLELGSSCEAVHRFQSGYIDSWDELACGTRVHVAVDEG
ncbi:MAG: hypothetical protein JNM84_18985 [Planctomycetes bacterium]|nr:hypothetical protein [Planctomycetota bacterium]